jgi:hypothetical protein
LYETGAVENEILNKKGYFYSSLVRENTNQEIRKRFLKIGHKSSQIKKLNRSIISQADEQKLRSFQDKIMHIKCV